jgi:hemoglobin-like flavoprotein
MTTELLEQVQTALLNAMIRDIEGKKSAESVKAYAEAYVTLANVESDHEGSATPKKAQRRRRDPTPTPAAD